MSFGALSGHAKEALGRAATAVGTSTTTGDGGMTTEEREASKHLVYQCLPSRYGFNPRDVHRADAIEIVIGQGAKPGGGGMLLGQKVSERVAGMRTLPAGIDQRSACRHPDWTGPDDLVMKIEELREATGLAEADLREGRGHPRRLRREAGRGGRGRRGRRRRPAGRDRGDAGRLHRARRDPDAGRGAPGRRGAAGDRQAPRGPARRVWRHPLGRRRGEGAGAGGGRRVHRCCLAHRPRLQPAGLVGHGRRRLGRRVGRTTRDWARRRATATTATPASARSASPRRSRSSRIGWTPRSVRGG